MLTGSTRALTSSPAITAADRARLHGLLIGGILLSCP
jgi:hypothetical protein